MSCRFACTALLLSMLSSAWAAQPTAAFYYGKDPSVRQLADFDWVVVDPDSDFAPVHYPRSRAHWIAYVSVGEITPNRGYYDFFPPSWIVGDDPEWHSEVIDQTSPAWPEFFVAQVVRPLWDRGFRGFFLDTLDAYQRVMTDPKEQEAQRQGLVRLIATLRRHYPQAHIFLNRGFELLPKVHGQVDGVVVESVFKGWDQVQQRYYDVASKDSTWLLAQMRSIRQQYHLPVIALDYCDPQQPACASNDVERLRRENLIPYVSDGLLDQVNDTALR